MLDHALAVALYAFAAWQARFFIYFASRARTLAHRPARRVLYVLAAVTGVLVLVLVAAGKELS